MLRVTKISGALLPVFFSAALFTACTNGESRKAVGPTDTVVDNRVHIVGWEHAGVALTGEKMGFSDIVRCKNRLFVMRFDGTVLTTTIPEFDWKPFPLPDSSKVFQHLSGDSTHVWFPTDHKIWEYNAVTNTFTNLVGDLLEFADTTKHWVDTVWAPYADSLRMHFEDVAQYKNELYAISYHIYGSYSGGYNDRKIMRYIGNGHWVHADSTLTSSMQTPLFEKFQVTKNYLWATAPDGGLFRYDGNAWEEIPGTTPLDYTDSSIGWSALCAVEHNGTTFIGTRMNSIWQLASNGKQTREIGVQRYDYLTGITDTFRTCDETFTLANHNGLLISPMLSSYRDDKAGIWRFLLQNSTDTLWENPEGDTLYGPVFVQPNYSYTFGMVSYGDTIFATASDFYGEKGGVFFLDLNKIAWYREYKKNGYSFK